MKVNYDVNEWPFPGEETAWWHFFHAPSARQLMKSPRLFGTYRRTQKGWGLDRGINRTKSKTTAKHFFSKFPLDDLHRSHVNKLTFFQNFIYLPKMGESSIA